MARQFKIGVTHFLQEGIDNLSDCLRIAFESALTHNIGKIVIFTARGQGVRLAIEEFLSLKEYRSIELVAVTFPVGKRFTDTNHTQINVEIAEAERVLLAEHNVPIVRAHLPFDPIAGTYKERGVLGQDLSLVGNALGLFGGSMSLCVQSVAMACDAGVVDQGQHVIAMTSDTAIVVQAAPTERLLCDLVIREILCKPAILSIGRKENSDQIALELEDAPPQVVEAVTKPTPTGLEKGDDANGTT
jgi:hypothetical protein